MKEDTTEIKAQTTAIKADTEEIKQDIRQISGLVEEIALLRLQVSQLKQENGSAGVTLQRFLDETSSYAESVVDATDPDQVDLDGMGNLPVIGEEDSDIYEDCSSEVDRPVDGQKSPPAPFSALQTTAGHQSAAPNHVEEKASHRSRGLDIDDRDGLVYVNITLCRSWGHGLAYIEDCVYVVHGGTISVISVTAFMSTNPRAVDGGSISVTSIIAFMSTNPRTLDHCPRGSDSSLTSVLS